MPIANYYTVSEAAELFGVTRQRMHSLIKTYNVHVDKVSARLCVIPKSEIKKIPKDRPNGVRHDRQQK